MVKETVYKKQLENKAGEQNIEIQVKKKIRPDKKVDERCSESGKASGRR